MTDKPWSGRFSQDTDALVEAFTESVSVDWRLYREDIEASVAHARMLARTGLLTQAEAEAIAKGLDSIREDIVSGAFRFDPKLEDVHMNIEAELTKRIGEAGKKLHTARSRNDQVATDFRIRVRSGLREIRKELKGFMGVLLVRASEYVDTIIPGMTHLQHAQPVSLAHHLLAYFEMMLRDYGRITQTLERMNMSPLGSAALAGTPHPIDRFRTAQDLGFEGPCRNSLDGVSDRDFAVEAVFAGSMIMMHLSRLSEEIIIWSSQPFSFVDLPDGYCTGSSIMPQKKNPDVAELVRGKVGSVYGGLFNLLTMMKGLPLAYNRDMQEDKKPVFESMDTVTVCLRVMSGLMDGLRPNAQALSRSLEDGYITATDIADYLAAKGMPFREAHHVTGRIISLLVHEKRRLAELSLDEFRSFSGLFDDDIFEAIKPENSVDRRLSFGGTARQNVRNALKEAKAMFEALEHED
jgi:argininosuccinate lyase